MVQRRHRLRHPEGRAVSLTAIEISQAFKLAGRAVVALERIARSLDGGSEQHRPSGSPVPPPHPTRVHSAPPVGT